MNFTSILEPNEYRPRPGWAPKELIFSYKFIIKKLFFDKSLWFKFLTLKFLY